MVVCMDILKLNELISQNGVIVAGARQFVRGAKGPAAACRVLLRQFVPPAAWVYSNGLRRPRVAAVVVARLYKLFGTGYGNAVAQIAH